MLQQASSIVSTEQSPSHYPLTNVPKVLPSPTTKNSASESCFYFKVRVGSSGERSSGNVVTSNDPELQTTVHSFFSWNAFDIQIPGERLIPARDFGKSAVLQPSTVDILPSWTSIFVGTRANADSVCGKSHVVIFCWTKRFSARSVHACPWLFLRQRPRLWIVVNIPIIERNGHFDLRLRIPREVSVGIAPLSQVNGPVVNVCETRVNVSGN